MTGHNIPANDKLFELRPVEELFAIVKGDFRTINDEGLIDEGRLIKTVMFCNEKMGIPVREIAEAGIPIDDFKGVLPKDFEKLFYVCGLRCTGSMITEQRNPFNNNFDQDIIYDARLDRTSLGGVQNYNVTIKRESHTTVHNYGDWVELDVNCPSNILHLDSPNSRFKGRGKYNITITKDGEIHTPFRSGLLYIMYVAAMRDEYGNILFPFHPMLTPYYEWTLKENILLDAIFNSDGDYGKMLEIAKDEKRKAWLDAFNLTFDKAYGEYAATNKKRELKWYNEWFRFFR